MLNRLLLKSAAKKHTKRTKRTYWAELGKTLPKVPSRVVSISEDEAQYLSQAVTAMHADSNKIKASLKNGYALQLLVSNQYLPQKGTYLPEARVNLGDTHTWSTMLYIDKKSQLHLNPCMYISDDLMQRNANNSNYNIVNGAAYTTHSYANRKFRSTPYHSDFYFPNLLFSVADDSWNDFIKKLPHQDVVSTLNLNEQRHLWVAYKYSSQNNELINQWRSQAISQYHFLASIVANITTDNDYLNAAYGPYHVRKDMNDSPLLNAHAFYTDNLDGASSTLNMKVDVNFFDVFKQIDQGVKPNTILTNRLPYLTPLFLNKFSHCPVWHQVHNIGLNMILPKVSDASGKVNKDQLDGFIADLPSSKNDPITFEKMVSDSQKILTRHLSTNLSSAFFHQARGNYGDFNVSEKELAEIKDYIQALVKDLIFPEFIRILQRLSPEELKEMKIKDFYGRHYKSINDVLNNVSLLNKYLINVTELFEKTLSSLNINQLNKLQQRWHRNITQINAHKPLSPFRFVWHPLFEKHTIGTVTFTCLTTDEELKTEGKEMQHCVGGYSRDCTTGKIHIIQVVAQSGERSTLELSVNESSNIVKIEQNSNKKNTEPCEEIKLATKQLLDKLNDGSIKMNENRGRANNTKSPIAVNEIYPYDLIDTDSQEAIYAAYRGSKDIPTKVLPACLMANSYQEMLEKINITTLIQDNLLTLTQKEKQSTLHGIKPNEIDHHRKLV